MTTTLPPKNQPKAEPQNSLPRFSLWSGKTVRLGAKALRENQDPLLQPIRESVKALLARARATSLPHPFTEPAFELNPQLIHQFKTRDTAQYWEKTLADHHGEQNPLPLPAYIYQEKDWIGFLQAFNKIREGMTATMECTLAGLAAEDDQLLDEGLKIWREMVAWKPGGFCDDWHGDMISVAMSMRLVRVALWQEERLTTADWKNLDSMMTWRMKETLELLKFYKIDQYPLDSHVIHGACIYASAVLAMEDHLPSMKPHCDWVRQKLESLFPVWGGSDGGWAAGSNYWKWSSVDWLLLADLYPLDHPLRQHPWIQNTGWFKIYCHPPYTQQGSFGDHCDNPPSPFDGALMRYLGSLTGKGEFTWYAEELTKNKHQVRDPGPLFDKIEGLSFELASLSIPQKSSAPTQAARAQLFEDTGIIAAHTHLENGSKNTMLLFRSSRWGSYNHAHADQNSFVIESCGEPLLIDAGYYPVYHHPHMKKFTIQTVAHNAILVDGVGQTIRNLYSRGRITRFEQTADAISFTGDATEAYAGRCHKVLRHGWFQKTGKVPFVIWIDFVETTHPHTLDWLLHSYEEMKINEKENSILISGWKVAGGKARAMAHLVTPHEYYWNQTDQFPAPADMRESDKPKQWHLTVTPKASLSQHVIISTIQIGTESTAWMKPHYCAKSGILSLEKFQVHCDPLQGFQKI
ncbi:MAG: heparinase II/III family protein [Verrucomicrobiota bacterium]